MSPFRFLLLFFIIIALLFKANICFSQNSSCYILKPSTYYLDGSPNFKSLLKLPFEPQLGQFEENFKQAKAFPPCCISISNSHFYFNYLDKKGMRMPKYPAHNFPKDIPYINPVYLSQSSFNTDLYFRDINVFPTGIFTLIDVTATSFNFIKDNGKFDLFSVTTKGQISIDSSKITMTISAVKTDKNDFFLTISNSTISLNIPQLVQKNSRLEFFNNTIDDFSYSVRFDEKSSVVVGNSKINKNFRIYDNLDFNPPVIKFARDTFDHAKITIDTFKKLSVTNCLILNNLSIISDNIQGGKKDSIEITGTDVNQIDFKLSNGFFVCFDVRASVKEKESTYKHLLDKFKKENDNQAYEDIDVQYKSYKFSKFGLAGQCWSWIDGVWWNYGYSKERILMWTFVFIVIFFISNLINSRKLFIFYSVFPDKSFRMNRKTDKYKNNTLVLTLILTIYIFFAIRIDFDKIKSKYTGLMIYFFIQYFIGLVCLFFLLNAILKI